MAHSLRINRVNREKLQERELSVLKEEEKMIVDLLQTYENALHKLQVEELTIKSQLSHARKVDLRSQNTTPVLGNSTEASGITFVEVMGGNFPSEHRPGISMNELQINQSTLNLDAAPLIHRMLHDSEVYEEEEDDDDNDTVDPLEE